MNTPRVILCISILALPCAQVSRAQAGLSGDPFGGQATERAARNSGFDNGRLQGTSALGQLEQLSGGRVDRPSTSRQNQTSQTQPPAPTKPRINRNAQLKAEVTGMLIEGLFSSIFNDNSAQLAAQRKAEAEAAAREAAERAEALRIEQERARHARILRAMQYRAEWDARDAEITDRLSGAFASADAGVHRNLFGSSNPGPDTAAVAAILGLGTDVAVDSPIAAAPNVPGILEAPENDPSVVDLRESSLVMQPLRPPTQVTRITRLPRVPRRTRTASPSDWNDQRPVRPRVESDAEFAALVGYFGPWLNTWYKETVVGGVVESTGWEWAKSKAKRFRADRLVEYANALYSFNEDRTELTQEVSGMYEEQMEETFGGASQVARILGNPYSNGSPYADSYWQTVAQRGRQMVAKTYELAFGQFTGHFDAPDIDGLTTPSGEGNFVAINGASDSRSLHWRLSNLGSFGHSNP